MRVEVYERPCLYVEPPPPPRKKAKVKEPKRVVEIQL